MHFWAYYIKIIPSRFSRRCSRARWKHIDKFDLIKLKISETTHSLDLKWRFLRRSVTEETFSCGRETTLPGKTHAKDSSEI